jgi:predicted esterase
MSRGYVTSLLVAALTFITGCTSTTNQPTPPPTAPQSSPTNTPVPTSMVKMASPTAELTFGFPEFIDPTQKYMFYLHGRIIEEQGIPAVSTQYGEYEYEAILNELLAHGFVVISEQRPKGTDADKYAQKIAEQISRLLEADVPPEQITVVGASKGSYIAATASNLLKNSILNFVLLGSCAPDMVTEWKQDQMVLYGNILAIYDSVDELAGSCQEIFSLSEGKGIARYDEIILHIGAGHGILYRPLDDWVLPTIEWAKK